MSSTTAVTVLTRAARQVRTAGAMHAGYGTLTRYPLGIVKPIPFEVHLAPGGHGVLTRRTG